MSGRGRNRTGSTSTRLRAKCGSCEIAVQAAGLQCEDCDCWFHPECVNVSDGQYQLLQTLTTTCWYCSPCFKQRQDRSVIVSLSATVNKLAEKLENLDTTLKSVDAAPKQATGQEVDSSEKTYHIDDSYKHRVKIVGIQESEKKFTDARQFDDKTSIENILGKLEIKNANVADCFRAGKYDKTRNRPLIVSFSSIWDARLIRSKAIERKLYQSDSILILNELSPADRAVEKQLLAKRHEVIQTGVDKSRIKIRNLKLYVDGIETKCDKN